MNMSLRFALPFVAVLCLGNLHAEDSQSTPAVPAQVNAGFSPSYTVTPIVHKLEARRGQTVAFSFEVTSELENVTATVMPILLRQDLNGVILPDLENPPPTNLRLRNREQIQLVKDVPVTIEGTINVPSNQSPFHSFGILIRDEGRETAKSQRGDSQFGVNFVTQYILRCDITVVNGRNDDIRNLVISQSEFVEFNGTPLAKVTVQNPTDSTVEFELDCRLLNDAMSESKTYVKLASPVRQNLVEPDRWLTRVMPQTTIEMFAPWPQAVFSGEYEMETRIVSKRRVYATARTTLGVAANRFRGQAAWVAQVAPGVHAHPSQIPLGQRKPYKRMQEIKLVNHSADTVTLKLSAVDASGNPLPWAAVRPEELRVPPGAKRRAVAALTRVTDRESHQTGYVSVISQTPDGELISEATLPLSFFGGESMVPKLDVAACQLASDGDDQGAVLVMPVTNQGSFPMPMHGIAKFADVANNPIEIHAGFGKWLLPGETQRLKFPLTGSKIETGSMRGVVSLLDDAANVMHSQEVQLRLPTGTTLSAK